MCQHRFIGYNFAFCIIMLSVWFAILAQKLYCFAVEVNKKKILFTPYVYGFRWYTPDWTALQTERYLSTKYAWTVLPVYPGCRLFCRTSIFIYFIGV